MSERIAIEHFRSVRRQLLESARHTGSASTSSEVQGATRESFIRRVLADNLPTLADYATGQLFDCMDKRSSQIDVIMQSSWSPRLHLDTGVNVVPVDSVLGCIEVKSTLKTAPMRNDSHLRAALLSSHRVKSLVRQRIGPQSLAVGQTFFSLKSKTPYFVVAYRGPSMATLISQVEEFGVHSVIRSCISHYSEYPHGEPIPMEDYLPEAMVVLDPAYCVIRNDGVLTETKPGLRMLCFEGEDCLAAFFGYLTRLVELWNIAPPACNFNAYLRPITSNTLRQQTRD